MTDKCVVPLTRAPYGGNSLWCKEQWDDYRGILRRLRNADSGLTVGGIGGSAQSLLSIAEEDTDVASCQEAKRGLIDAVSAWARDGEGSERLDVAIGGVSAIHDVFKQHNDCTTSEEPAR
ncbi:hypothetical protein ACH4TC_18695 [Streptomyces spororaveus]|uniref:hypothetical protein n=1 Tax=Streptomyces spororaveus TaxID=284039 RepID=UPI0037A5CC82